MILLSDVLCVKSPIAVCKRELLNIPVAFALGHRPGCGFRVSICGSAGWTWGFAGAVMWEFATTPRMAGSSQHCPLPAERRAAFKGSKPLWFSSRGDFALWGNIGPSLGTLLIVTTWGVGCHWDREGRGQDNAVHI